MVIVVEENKNYAEVIGSPDAPYINQLAAQNALAAAYFGVAPVSLPNYFMLTVGDPITTVDTFTGTVTNDNIVRELTNAGKTWKVYAEDLPSVGYLGGDTGNYVKHHNPFVYFSDVQNSPSQQNNVVPFTQFATDLANNALPNYAFVVPNIIDDGHSCPPNMAQCDDTVEVQNTDDWLKTNIAPLLGNPSFSDGLLAIVWDSGDVNFTNGGGQVPLILAGAGAKTGFVSTAFYQHPSLLRLSMEHLQLSPNLGAAATAPDMADMVPSP